MTNDVFRIVYCSRNIVLGSEGEELAEILATSRRNNQAVGVTGALLYTDGMFVQTLEGEFEAVQSVFERIQSDPRHEDVVVLQAESVDERNFGTWAMAHAEPRNLAQAHATLAEAVREKNSKSADSVIGLLCQVVSYGGA